MTSRIGKRFVVTAWSDTAQLHRGKPVKTFSMPKGSRFEVLSESPEGTYIHAVTPYTGPRGVYCLARVWPECAPLVSP